MVKEIIDPKTVDDKDADQPLFGGRKVKKPYLKEYIEEIFTGETMRLERYKWIHKLEWYDNIPPLYYPLEEVTNEPANPFNINYSWITKKEINNRLPNQYVF